MEAALAQIELDELLLRCVHGGRLALAAVCNHQGVTEWSYYEYKLIQPSIYPSFVCVFLTPL